MLMDLSLNEYLKAVASGDPTPGGGSAAALAGALGAALASMAAGLTVGRKKFAEVDGLMRKVQEKTSLNMNKMAEFVDKDAAAFDSVMQAYRLPKNTEEEARKRNEEIEKALEFAARVPLETLYAAVATAHLLKNVSEGGNPNAFTDAAVGVELLMAAATGAYANVRINLADISDENPRKAEVAKEADELMADIRAQANAIREDLQKKLP